MATPRQIKRAEVKAAVAKYLRKKSQSIAAETRNLFVGTEVPEWDPESFVIYNGRDRYLGARC